MSRVLLTRFGLLLDTHPVIPDVQHFVTADRRQIALRADEGHVRNEVLVTAHDLAPLGRLLLLQPEDLDLRIAGEHEELVVARSAELEGVDVRALHVHGVVLRERVHRPEVDTGVHRPNRREILLVGREVAADLVVVQLVWSDRSYTQRS